MTTRSLVLILSMLAVSATACESTKKAGASDRPFVQPNQGAMRRNSPRSGSGPNMQGMKGSSGTSGDFGGPSRGSSQGPETGAHGRSVP